MSMGNYRVLERIGVTAAGALHSATHIQDGSLVILKLPANGNAVDGLRQEYAWLKSLDAPEILKPLALIEDKAHPALVLEPFAGEGLDTVLARQPRLSWPVALAIAVQAARALAALHAAGIVQRDIRPANFVLAHFQDNVRLKLADLSQATSREDASAPRTAGSDWAYISPEQTGRMNRQTDYRTDFYSLGVMLYRLLTGRLPFEADDPLEWVHCHLARMPVPPHELDADIPSAVSALVQKLLAKMPEERYQSAGGLLADLEHCLAQWQETGEIAPFALGRRDVADRFRIPPKLYGREREAAALLAVFEAVTTTGTSMLVTVAGPAGVGKSALTLALRQPIEERGGYFLAGKFDQYRRDIPYATLVQAFDGLVRQILSESDAGIAHWRKAIREALEPNAQLMVSLIPQLEFVIGPQPPVPDVAAHDVQRRFLLVFRRFLSVFARHGHPLVLFLDDLQWVDTGTLGLLVDLATHPEVRHLLLIGAYRDNEVDSNHPLMHELEAIRQAGGAARRIVLASLTIDDVAQLVAESLHCPPAEAWPLAQLVLDKTGGNPFFTRQFLTALADEKLLAIEPDRETWEWDLGRIQAKGYTDNVGDLMVARIARLPERTRDALKTFACLSNAADFQTLALVLEQSPEAMHDILREGVRAGLVIRRAGDYTFLHDRIQEAAYSLIPEDARAGEHLRIGRLLASGLSPEEIGERIFDVVNQLNRGSGLVETSEERERIAGFNLAAGKRAKEATAYAAALAYLAAGAAMLAEDRWEERHDLAFALELSRAECEFLTGARDEAEARFAELAHRAASLPDLATVTRLRVELFVTVGQSARALEVCLDYLRRVGVQWSTHPTEEEVRQEYDRMWRRLGGRPIEALLDLPRMSDPVACGTLDVLATAMPAALFSDSNLRYLVIGRIANLSLEHGNSDASCNAYAWLGAILGTHFGNYEAGFRFGRLGIDLVEQRRLDRFKARVYHDFGSHVIYWSRHLQSGRVWLQRAFEAAQQAGDLTYAAYSCANLVTHLLVSGEPLAEVQREAESRLDFARHAQFGLIIDIITAQIQLVRTLRGLTPVFGAFDAAGFDERRFEQHLEEDPHLAIPACWYWIRKLRAHVHAGKYPSALAAAAKARKLLWTSQFFFEAVEYEFFAALAHAGACAFASPAEQREHRMALVSHHRQLQIWADGCPENFADRAALAGAEIARLDGRALDAELLYEQAIRAARDNHFVHQEALANELAGRFYLARGLETNGFAHLGNARSCYARWGADGMVRLLDERYPRLAIRAPSLSAADSASAQRIDVGTVVKASQAVSGEIELPKLIEKLMTIALQNAGGNRGLLILSRNDGYWIEAEARARGDAVEVTLVGAPMTATDCPEAIVRYVLRTRQRVILDDASRPGQFAEDAYLRHRPLRSVLCLPLLRQGQPVGALYLENSEATHVFTVEQTSVLELLASQAAISLDNARLYADVRDSHARIRRLVESNIIGILFWDASGNIIDANDAFLRMTGYSRDEVKSGALQWTAITPPEYAEVDARVLEELERTGIAQPFEKEYIRKDGTRIPILVGAALFEQSRDTGVAFVLDLTEQRRAETERQARRAAELANRAKSVFLANMSHELRTPLNGILGYAQVLERDPALDERHVAKATVIRKSGEHLLTLINDILDLTKIEAGKMELYPDEIRFAPFVQDIIDIAGLKAAQKGLELVCQFDPDMPQWIQADEKRLRQVLLNLLSNAVKFTDRGQVALRVSFTPPDRLQFKIDDTGIGIAAGQLETIFEPFEQVGDRQHRSGGTGLGLAISRQYARLMGGDIQVESRLGEGSTFRFEIQAQPVSGGATAASMMEEGASGRTVTGYAGSRKKILVVDDSADIQDVLTDLLAPLGFDVSKATDGCEALEAARRVQPDLIVMDVAMPQLDGLAAARQLRQSELFREVPIIAVSASVSAGDSEQCLAAGMNACLPKPIDADKLLDQMARLLRLQWTYRPRQASSTAGATVAPPAEEMEVLHRLAKLGNMQDILRRAAYLAELDQRYAPLASQLSLLAKRYQSKAILKLVEKWLKENQVT